MPGSNKRHISNKTTAIIIVVVVIKHSHCYLNKVISTKAKLFLYLD